MTSFLDKLKKEDSKKEGRDKVFESLKETAPEKEDGVLQLDVDIYQTDEEIMIYASMPGVDPDTLDILMEDEADVITIRGEKSRPKVVAAKKEEEKWLVQECEWGSFFRQIILPKEVDASRISAKLQRGVLALRLPFLKGEEQKKKIRISDIS